MQNKHNHTADVGYARCGEGCPACWEELTSDILAPDKRQKSYDELTFENQQLREGLLDAVDGILQMVKYVPAYFVRKWKLDQYAPRALKLLESTTK